MATEKKFNFEMKLVEAVQFSVLMEFLSRQASETDFILQDISRANLIIKLSKSLQQQIVDKTNLRDLDEAISENEKHFG